MAVPILSLEQMRAAVSELEQALYNHERWTEAIYASLVCRLPPDERDIADEAWHKCQFGQWYYAAGHLKLHQYPGFEEIEIEHRHMHQYAATLLTASARGMPISMQDYERFISAMKRTRLEIGTLKRVLEMSIYTLDPLTGVPSRVNMLTDLREQQELVKRGHQCCVAMFDLDRFKDINDKYGHDIGDQVLIAVARYIKLHLRPYDKVFRYGGEEFLLCLPDTGLSDGHEICQRLGVELMSLRHSLDAGTSFSVTVSGGVTVLDANVPVEEAIKRADIALSCAKAHGRNCVLQWGTSMRQGGAVDSAA